MHPDDHDLNSPKRLMYSIVIASLLLLIPIGTHVYALLIDPNILNAGLRPWDLKAVYGILTMHFLHGGTNHLVSNAIPFFVLGSALFYFYRETAWKVLLWITLLTGIWLWFIGKPGSMHIGASGIVYGLVSFHLTSAAIRKNKNLMAFALLVVFLYGGFIWSIFPDFFPDKNISWEGHLAGLTAGILMAFVYRHEGPKPDPMMHDDDEDDPDEEPEEIEPEEDEDLLPKVEDEHASRNSTLSAEHPYRYHVT